MAERVSLFIDDDTRSLLIRLVRWDAPDFEEVEHAIEDARRDQAWALYQRLGHMLALLDQLGWTEEDHRGDAISVDPDVFCPWLRFKLREWRSFVADDIASLRRQELGESMYYPDGMTQEEAVADSQGRIDRLEGEVALVVSLLDRLEPAEAVA